VAVGPPGDGRPSALGLDAGEEPLALLHREAARVAAPGAASGTRWSSGLPGRPMRCQIASHGAGTAGLASTATMAQRLEGVAHHGVDLGAGLGLPRLVGLEVGVGLPHERQVASRAWTAATESHAAARRGRRRPATAASGLSGRGAGPTPSHFLPTTVATRTAGCRGCWRGRRCSGRPCPRRRSRRRAERGVAQEVVAEPVDAEVGDQVEPGRSGWGRGLAHLLAADQQPAVHVDCRWGGSRPAAISIAGQYTQWKRMMSLPIRWWTWGHQVAKRSSSVAEADGGGVVDERVVPDVEDVARPTAPGRPSRARCG
jgi:hypothetical protein